MRSGRRPRPGFVAGGRRRRPSTRLWPVSAVPYRSGCTAFSPPFLTVRADDRSEVRTMSGGDSRVLPRCDRRRPDTEPPLQRRCVSDGLRFDLVVKCLTGSVILISSVGGGGSGRVPVGRTGLCSVTSSSRFRSVSPRGATRTARAVLRCVRSDPAPQATAGRQTASTHGGWRAGVAGSGLGSRARFPEPTRTVPAGLPGLQPSSGANRRLGPPRE